MPEQVIGGLYISDIDGIREGDTSYCDRVIGVCEDDASDNVSCEYDHFPMSDGTNEDARGEYSYERLREAIDAAVAARIQRETVCVHCHAGISRSAAVCIAVLAVVGGMSYEDALKRVEETKYVNPNTELRQHVRKYIDDAT